nr:Deblocking aminopeptidase (EC 3.4.11.-) [uncultured bacterium]
MLRDTLKTLLSAYGPSGNEHAVAEAVKSLIAAHVDSMRVDAMGNLIVEKYGSDEQGKRIMFSAHMDHIGFVVTDIDDKGFLRVHNVGGISPSISIARHVVFENGTEGVIYSQPRKDEDPAMKHLFIDIGADSREEAAQCVQPGDMAVYAPDFFELGSPRVASPAMDDRCCCALLCELMMYLDEPRNTVVGVFSSQEEVGVRGATTAAYSVKPDIGLGLDVTVCGDTPELKIPAITLGAGAAVKIMDRSMIASPSVREALFLAAKQAGVPVQREILPFGGQDGSAIQHSRAGVPAGCLSIPCRYTHSPAEVIDMRDMEGALKILLKFVENV